MLFLLIVLIIILMILFVFIPEVIETENIFQNMIKAGTIVYLINYLGTFFAILYLSLKKKVIKISWWEIILYFITISLIITILVIILFPFIVQEPWKFKNSIMLGSYLSSMVIGFAVWSLYELYQKVKLKNMAKIKDRK